MYECKNRIILHEHETLPQWEGGGGGGGTVSKSTVIKPKRSGSVFKNQGLFFKVEGF